MPILEQPSGTSAASVPELDFRAIFGAAPTAYLLVRANAFSSRELARGMAGDITAHSAEGEGALFTLTLPRR